MTEKCPYIEVINIKVRNKYVCKILGNDIECIQIEEDKDVERKYWECCEICEKRILDDESAKSVNRLWQFQKLQTSDRRCPYQLGKLREYAWLKQDTCLVKDEDIYFQCNYDAGHYDPIDCKKFIEQSLLIGLKKDTGSQKKTEKKKKEKPIETSFLNCNNRLIEEIWWENKTPMFAVWNGESVGYVEEIEHEGQKYVPIKDKATTEGAVLLPSKAEDYESLERLVQDITNHIHSYVDVSPEYERFVVWYILMTWVYDKLNTLGYLRVLADHGCGKSRFLDVVGGVCYKSCVVSGSITPAPIYRMIKRWGGTIILDEADFRDSTEKSEVITILNCGFEKGRPVIRCQKENPDDLQFLPTFCPKIIATRKGFSDTALESRCLTETMRPTERDDIPVLLPKRYYDETELLRNKLLMFRFKTRESIDPEKLQDVDLGDVEMRLKQAMASFTILFCDVPELMGEFRQFVVEYNKELVKDRSQTFEGAIVKAILILLGRGEVVDGGQETLDGILNEDKNITPKDIAEVIDAEDDILWKPMKGKNTSAGSVGKVLRSLGLKTELKRVGTKTPRCLVVDVGKLDRLRKRYVSDVSNVSDVSGSASKQKKEPNNNNNKKSGVKQGEPETSETNETSETEIVDLSGEDLNEFCGRCNAKLNENDKVWVGGGLGNVCKSCYRENRGY